MKRTICFILLLALSLSCFACSKPVNEGEVNANLAGADGAAAKENKPQNQNPAAEPTIESTAAPAEESTPEPTGEPTAEPVYDLMPWEEFPDEYTKVTIEMPCNFIKRTEGNASTYDIDPFEISFALPAGWSVKDEPDENGLMFGFERFFVELCSKQYVFYETGRCIGAFGYYCYEEPEYGVLGEIYPYIGMAAHYKFCLDECARVTETENTVTEVTSVYHSKHYSENYPYTAMASDDEKYNLGILSHNPERLISIAFELEIACVSYDQYMDIAESLRFN